MRETIENKRRKRVPSEAELKELEGMRESIKKSLTIEPFKLIEKTNYFLTISIKYESNENIAEAYYFLGYIYNYIGDNTSSIENFQFSESYTDDVEFLNRIYISIGVAYRHNGDYAKAIQSYTRALELGVSSHLEAIYNNMAVVYSRLNDFNKTIVYLNKADEIYNSNGEHIASLGIKNNIGKILITQKKYTKAKKHIDRVKKLAEAHEAYKQIILSNYLLGNLSLDTKKYNEAYSYLIGAYKLCKIHQNKNQLFSILLLLGEVSQKKKDPREAFKYLNEAFQLSKKISIIEQIECLIKLHEYLAIQKRYVKALFYLKLLNKLKKLSVSEVKKNELNKVEVLFERTEKKINLENLYKLSEINLDLKVRAEQLEDKNLKLEKVFKNIKNGQLIRTQLSPSYLNNSIKSISNLIESNNNNIADKYLLLFSKFTRNVFENAVKEKITLIEEINLIKHFLECEGLRLNIFLKSKIVIQHSINSKKFYLPPMILLQIIEAYILKKSKSNLESPADSLDLSINYRRFRMLEKVVIKFRFKENNPIISKRLISIIQHRIDYFNIANVEEKNKGQIEFRIRNSEIDFYINN